jgi:hypothetical protein
MLEMTIIIVFGSLFYTLLFAVSKKINTFTKKKYGTKRVITQGFTNYKRY